MVAAALASHCRRAPDMGILSADTFESVVALRGSLPPARVPAPGQTVVLDRGACERARRTLQPAAAPLEWPAGWRPLETCHVLEVTLSSPLACYGSRVQLSTQSSPALAFPFPLSGPNRPGKRLKVALANIQG